MPVQVRPGAFKNTKTMNLYYLELDYARSAWKAWQKGCYAAVKKYDRMLFTKEQILSLGMWLNSYRLKFRNSEPVSMPDWEFCKQYDCSPMIGIGPGCYIQFKPVAGYFNQQNNG